MRSRVELHKLLASVSGVKQLYFQPPASIKMQYPCIVYQLSSMFEKWADNKPYVNAKCYTVTVIDKDPDSEIPNKLINLPFCRFDRFYPVDNLNHWVFILYF